MRSSSWSGSEEDAESSAAWPSLASTGIPSHIALYLIRRETVTFDFCIPVLTRVRPTSLGDDDEEEGDVGASLVVHHLAHGSVQIGHWDDDPLQLRTALSQLWAHSKIAHKVKQ